MLYINCRKLHVGISSVKIALLLINDDDDDDGDDDDDDDDTDEDDVCHQKLDI